MGARTIIKSLVLACSIVLAACSSDDDPAPTSTTKISGVAKAPLGVVAQFQTYAKWWKNPCIVWFNDTVS